MAEAAASESGKSATKTPTSSAAEPKSYSDLVSTLPARGGWVSLVQYQNYWLNPGRLQHIIPVKELYKPRADDILLATYLKCGTTWLKALAFAITTRGGGGGGEHPLLTVHPQEAVPHLEVHTPGQGLADIENLPSPRLLGTHLPLSLLPPAVSSTAGGCRVVYLCRQPKDVFVSLWHFINGMHGGRPPVEMDAALGMFCEGVSPFGPVWEHYLEYWKASLARPEQVLFLRYEEMVSDPVRAVKKLAEFFAVPFTEEEERGGVPEEIVRLCSFDMLSGLESNQTGDLDCGDNTVIGKSTFFRKGKVGDWENHMTKEMAKKVDDVFEEKLKGSGLVF